MELKEIINKSLLDPNREGSVKIELNPKNSKQGRITWGSSYPTTGLVYNSPILDTQEINTTDYYPIDILQKEVLNKKDEINKNKQASEEFKLWKKDNPVINKVINTFGKVGDYIYNEGLGGDTRVQNLQRLWKNNPEYAKKLTEAGNEAGLAVASVAAPWLASEAAPLLGLIKPGTFGGNLIGLIAGFTAVDNTLNEGYKAVTGSKLHYMDDALDYLGIQNPVGRFAGYMANPLNFVNYGKWGNAAFNSLKLLISEPIVQSYYRNYKIPKLLNKDAKAFDGTVAESYFNAPDKWYRITNSPEIHSIKLQGLNVTSLDAGTKPDLQTIDNSFRELVIDRGLVPGTGANEGYWIYPLRIRDAVKKSQLGLVEKLFDYNANPGIFRHVHAAHGNRSQAAWQKLWDYSTSSTSEFPGYVLEGNPLPDLTIPRGITRSNFKITPIEDVPYGDRVGFKTGKMPIEGLRAFRKLPSGRYLYEGEVIPNKTIKIEQTPLISTYLNKNNEWDVSKIKTELLAGKQDVVDWIESSAYKNAAQNNIKEAESMGLKYVPTYEYPVYQKFKNNGYPVKLVVEPNSHYAGYISTMTNSPITINLARVKNIRTTAAHEGTHAIRHAWLDPNYPLLDVRSQLDYLRYKNSLVFDDNVADLSEEAGNQFYDFGSKGFPHEAVTNSRDLGKLYGIKVGDPYPGSEETLKLLLKMENEAKPGFLKKFILAFKKDKESLPYVWKALNGTQWITTPFIINSLNEK